MCLILFERRNLVHPLTKDIIPRLYFSVSQLPKESIAQCLFKNNCTGESNNIYRRNAQFFLASEILPAKVVDTLLVETALQHLNECQGLTVRNGHPKHGHLAYFQFKRKFKNVRLPHSSIQLIAVILNINVPVTLWLLFTIIRCIIFQIQPWLPETQLASIP